MLAVLVASACSDSTSPPIRVDGDDEPRYVRTLPRGGVVMRTKERGVALRGHILSAAGKAASEIPVRLEKVTSGFGPITCFFGCRFPPRCSEGDASESNQDGRFQLQMCKPAGRDLSLTLGEGPAGAARVTLPLFLKQDRMLLPRLRFWEGNTSFDTRTGRVTWTDLPQEGFGALHRYEVASHPTDRDLDPMWFRFDATPGETIDSRVFEDTTGQIFVTALTTVVVEGGCGGECRHEARFTTKGILYRGAGTPLSRGKRCFVGTPTGRSVQSCYLNDGDFFRDLIDYACSTQLDCEFEDGRAGVDLGRSASVDLIVVRGCEFCRVSISTDGRTWQPVKETGSEDSLRSISLRELGSGTRARYVRVNDAEDVLELSVWQR